MSDEREWHPQRRVDWVEIARMFGPALVPIPPTTRLQRLRFFLFHRKAFKP